MKRLLGLVVLLAVAPLVWALGASAQGGGVSILSHDSARGVYVDHANALSVNCVSGCTSAGSTPVNQSGTWTVQAAHQGGQWNLDSVNHVKAAMAHVIGTVTIEGRGTAGTSTGGVATVQGVSGGTPLPVSNVAHVTSTLHVAGTVQANTGSGNLTCHSTATFANSADAIVIHGSGLRVFICGVVFVSSAAQSVSIVEGTGAACGTNTLGLIGAPTAAGGMSIGASGGMSSIAPFPWLATATAGNNVCILLSSTGRVSGVITYRGAP